MTMNTSARIAATASVALFLAFSGAAIAQAPVKASGASSKNASENSIGAANAQIDAEGGTTIKKRVKKARKAPAQKAGAAEPGNATASPAARP